MKKGADPLFDKWCGVFSLPQGTFFCGEAAEMFHIAHTGITHFFCPYGKGPGCCIKLQTTEEYPSHECIGVSCPTQIKRSN